MSNITSISLPRASLGLISELIINLEVVKTKKEVEKLKAQIYSFLRTVKPKEAIKVKAPALYQIYRSLDIDSGDVWYTFYYRGEENANT